MRLTKDGISISLSNENHIEAYLSCGWVEEPAQKEAPKEEKKKKQEK